MSLAEQARWHHRSEVLHNMSFGPDRRKELLEVIPMDKDGLVVNIRHCLQIKEDPDLRKLLKQGKLRRSRLANRHIGRTYLQVV